MSIIANVPRPMGKATRKMEVGTYDALPNTDTKITHHLGRTPVALFLTPRTTGAAGYAMETSRDETSITLRASVSGVDIEWTAIG